VPYESLRRTGMFRNDEGRVFQDVTTSRDFGKPAEAHASFGDVRQRRHGNVFEEMGGARVDSYPSVVMRIRAWKSLVTLELEA